MAEKKTSINKNVAAPANNAFTPPSEKDVTPPKVAPGKVRILTGEGWRRVKLKEQRDKKK